MKYWKIQCHFASCSIDLDSDVPQTLVNFLYVVLIYVIVEMIHVM
jgi:hypothetical protein